MNKNIPSVRAEAHQLMRESLSQVERDRNWQFTNDLRKRLADHPIKNHPIIALLNSGKLTNADLSFLHLEFREAGVEVFTDALVMAMFNTKQLEPRLAPGAKMAARALLTLNCLDEFGFRVGQSDSGDYLGTPSNAHYPLFEVLLSEMGMSQAQILEHVPTRSSTNLKTYIEANYDSYPVLLALLAVAEYQAIVFSSSLRNAVESVGVDVSKGYYQAHGLSTDTNCDAADDDHEADLWAALVQGVTEDQFDNITQKAEEYLDLWMMYWSEMYEAIKESTQIESPSAEASC